MMTEDDNNSRSPETSKTETTESASLSAGSITGLPELDETKSPTKVASYEYNGTTYYRHEGVDVPTTFRLKSRHFDSTSRVGTNNDVGIKLPSEDAVAYRSHRTPFSMRGLGDSWSSGGAPWSSRGGLGVSWPRKSLLSSFGESDLTQNFRKCSVNENRDSLARRRDSKIASSWNGTKSQDYVTPLYTKSGQPYVPISIANWYRRRTHSGENDEMHSEPESTSICQKDRGVSSLDSRECSENKCQSNELANGESNDVLESILNQDDEFLKVEAIDDLSVKDLKCLKLTATPAKALVRIFEPMLENWKGVISAVSDTSDKKNVVEEIKEKAEKSQNTIGVEPESKENGDSVPILQGNEKQNIILQEMSQKLLGNSELVFPQKRQIDSPVTPTKIPEVKKQLECKKMSFREDLAYANSCSPATGLHMIEATSTVRNYVFTIGDRGEICRFLAPLVKELVIMNKSGGKGRKSLLHIGVDVESQQQFFCAINAANAFFKFKGFQFIHKHAAKGKDVLSFLSEDKVIPKVDCNGMYQITIKFNLPKGNEKKVDASMGRELEKEVRGCGVEKISFGPGERILLMGHVKDIIKVSKKVKNIFDIIPSKHTWNNEPGMARISSSKKDRKAKPKERSNKVELETSNLSNLNSDIAQRFDLNWPTIQQEKEMSAPLLSNQCVTLTLLDSDSACDPTEMELPKVKSSEDTHDHKSAMRSPPHGDRKDDTSEVKTSPLTNFIKLMKGVDSISNLKLLQDRFVKCPNDNEENEGQAFEIVERAMAAVGDVNGEMQKKATSSGNNINDEKLEDVKVTRDDDNDEVLEKAKATGDNNQMVKSTAYIQSEVFDEIFKENAESKKEVCQLGKENELIFKSIDENNLDIVKEDTNWYGNISDFVTVKNDCSLWNVYVTFEAKEETETAYFGLREKYNGVDGGCQIKN